MDWQPIETMPRDGTRVLCVCASVPAKSIAPDRVGYMAVSCWRQPKIGRGYIGLGEFNSLHWPATHWMPLPPPPSSDASA